MKRSFTLLELLVVIVIIGVLATLGITHYGVIREMAIDREATANLKLIIAANRIYRMETDGQWYTSTDVGQINTNLKLSLPAGTDRNWNYASREVAGGVRCADAQRNGGDARIWGMLVDYQNAHSIPAGDCRSLTDPEPP